ncbi:hypothetical protein FSARC_13515 [Fusarium sarcochroum]|uniref:Uncharacterized protein n=1 Tax=Fusarium sarcochroum TaxID=1208366 RepID=A0A8H4WSM4_9HYPO|nr:hypothetical protein FSARC_13515 [Fusarium sarcochroum]
MSFNHMSNAALSTIGAITLAVWLYKIFSFVRIYFLQSDRLHRYNHPSSTGTDAWALVTGASDGIGRQLAQELAGRGFNVVLHGRNETKLANVMSEVQQKFPSRSFKVLVADASSVRSADHSISQTDRDRKSQHGVDFEAIKSQLSGLNLTILINNAGKGIQGLEFAPLEGYSESSITGNVSLNALFPIHLIRTLLPTLIRNSPALIINISSVGDKGFPLLVSYSASKSFLMTMTESLGLELKLEGHDVDTMCVRVSKTTGVVGSDMQPNFSVPSASAVAKAALARVGCGERIVVGHWVQSLQQVVVRMLPRWLWERTIIDVMQNERAEEMKRK